MNKLRQSLTFKVTILAGAVLFIGLAAHIYIDIVDFRQAISPTGGLSTERQILAPSVEKERTARLRSFALNRIWHGAIFFGVIFAAIIFGLRRFVHGPVLETIEGTRRIARGEFGVPLDTEATDEIGLLGRTITAMGQTLFEKQIELNRQRDEYQRLFELVPCIITVQDRDFRLIRYNREFEEKFNPQPGDYCFRAYKGRNAKCPECPVERTFDDGLPHFSEETGFGKDGSPTHWVVQTSPIKNEAGEVVAAMEMSLDVTHRKQLEDKLDKTEKRYYAIFNNIPNPVFVLAFDTLEVLDCNQSVEAVYGYAKKELIQHSFLRLFPEGEKYRYAAVIKTQTSIAQVKQVKKSGEELFVNIRVSPSEYPWRKVLLVTTSDITAWLATQQQLLQASKMATLGEMATGVAHELNQPLTVIKTASNFMMKKVRQKKPISDDILLTMTEEIDGHVDRATKIINHMRQFGRKSDMTVASVQINDVFEAAFEILGQQLKLRGIDVIWELQTDLPLIKVDPDRLEQVVINLLINARDAIEDGQEGNETQVKSKTVRIKSYTHKKRVIVEVNDSGKGIAPDIREKIFEPFFTTKKVGHGTGLGLSISYNIIKDCGGRIEAGASAEGGARFILKFPVPDENEH
jgi:histidine kinase